MALTSELCYHDRRSGRGQSATNADGLPAQWLVCASDIALSQERDTRRYVLVSPRLPEAWLPNGMQVFCLQRQAVPFGYASVQAYFKNGIEVREGDTVFDVGANIGLFTLSVSKRCKQNVAIYAFEPIPAIFEVLRLNAQRYAPGQLHIFPYGLSRECTSMRFAYYPRVPGLSTAYPDGLEEERSGFKNAILSDLMHLDEAPSILRWLRQLPMWLRLPALELSLRVAFRAKTITCPLVTLSSVIREHGVGRIDLLKVDVERGELDVFLGIKEQDWPKIKQVVAEVHSVDHRVETIARLLKEHGFAAITVEPHIGGFDQANLFHLYASR